MMSDSSQVAPTQQGPSKGSKRPSRLKASIGVEIGYNAIYMVRLVTAAGGQVVFDKCQSFHFDPKLDRKSEEFIVVFRAALKLFCGSSKEHVIWATTPNLEQTRVNHIEVPQVNDGQLQGAIYWGLQREESFVEANSVVDFQIEEGSVPKPDKANLDVTAAIIDLQTVENVRQPFSQVGYALSGITTPLFALRNLVELRGAVSSEIPFLLCQIGVKATTLSVLLDRRLVFTRNVSLGLQTFAESLTKDLGIELPEASELVLKLGQGDADLSGDDKLRYNKALRILEPVFGRAVRQVERTIEFYQSNYNSQPIQTIFVGGEVAARGELFKFLSKELAAQVIPIDPFELLGFDGEASLAVTAADRVAYGAAFGLAIEAHDPGVNLANTFKQRQVESKNSRVFTCVSLALIALTVLATLLFISKRAELNKIVSERDKVKTDLNSYSPRLSPAVINATTAKVQKMQLQRKDATKRYEGIALLSEITELTPSDISLLHISSMMEEPAITVDVKSSRIKKDEEKLFADEKGTMLLKGAVTGERASLEAFLTVYITKLRKSGLIERIDVESSEVFQGDSQLFLTFTLSITTFTEPS